MLKTEPKLTNMQQKIACLIAKGYTNYQIASALKIAEGTVNAHIHNIFNKFRFHNRAQIAVLAYEKQIIDYQ
jgi:DNA-binding NarL/FixJ family response regulator